MDNTRSVESMTNFILEEAMDTFIMQLNHALKNDTFSRSSLNFSLWHGKMPRSLNWPWWFLGIHNEIWSWSVPDEHVFLWIFVFRSHDKIIYHATESSFSIQRVLLTFYHKTEVLLDNEVQINGRFYSLASTWSKSKSVIGLHTVKFNDLIDLILEKIVAW